MPRVRAASASAAPWLPEEWVTTPRAACASSSDHTALQAPRNLNAPARCRCSHLKWTAQPASASSERERSTGVTCACGAIRAAAASTSLKPGSLGAKVSMRSVLRGVGAVEADRGGAGDRAGTGARMHVQLHFASNTSGPSTTALGPMTIRWMRGLPKWIDQLLFGFSTLSPPLTCEPTPTVTSPLTVEMPPSTSVSTRPMPPLTVLRCHRHGRRGRRRSRR